jgi:hypothetical protein
MSTIAAAARAASVAPETAIPQSALERRGVVHAVAGHADDVAGLLQHIDDVELVLREDLGEAVRLLDRRRKGRGLMTLGIAEAAGVEDVRSHPQLLGGFPGDGDRIAGHHLDADAHLAGGCDRRLGVIPRWVE